MNIVANTAAASYVAVRAVSTFCLQCLTIDPHPQVSALAAGEWTLRGQSADGVTLGDGGVVIRVER
jgi:hypothetical protein